MSKIFNKIKFLLRKPKVVIVTGDGRALAKEAIFQVLKQYFRIGKDVLIFEADAIELKKFQFFLKKSPLSVLVSTEGIIEVQDKKTGFKKLTFSFQEEADFRASDVRINGGTNFKIIYKGNVIPFWFKKVLQKPEIYSVLAGISVGTILDLNFIEISQTLKNYSPEVKSETKGV